jgi:hypothetical protein
MKLRFPESEIQTWAKKYSYPQDETSLMSLRPAIQNAGCLTKQQLRLAARWKSPRSAGHIERNDDEYVKEITSWSFSANEQRSKQGSLDAAQRNRGSSELTNPKPQQAVTNFFCFYIALRLSGLDDMKYTGFDKPRFRCAASRLRLLSIDLKPTCERMRFDLSLHPLAWSTTDVISFPAVLIFLPSLYAIANPGN